MTPTRSVSVLVLAVACVALIAAQRGPSPIAEEEGVVLDDAEALALDARMYAEEFGVSFDEALDRMTIMLYGDGVVAGAASAEGGDLAGRFFDNKAPEFGLTIATRKASRQAQSRSFTPRTRTNYGQMNAAQRQERNAQRRAARQEARLSEGEVRKAEDKLARPVTVRVKYKTGQAHSLAELQAGLDAVVQGSASIPGLTAASVDEVGNTLHVFVTEALSAQAERAVAALTSVPVVVDVLPGGFVPAANMRGGSKLYSSSSATSSSSRSCMTAFGARSNTLKTSTGAAMTGMITAAHCPASTYVIADDGKNKALTTPAGHVSDTRGGSNNADLRFVYASSQDPVGLGTFYFDGTTSLRAVAAIQSRGGTAVGSGSATSVGSGTATGSYICHLGQTSLGSTTSMQSCGEVISVTAAQAYDGSLIYYSGGSFVMVRNTSSGKGTVLGPSGTGTLRCYQGDSGGPWFAGTVAYGVLSSCAWEGGVANSNRVLLALYTSLDYVGQAGSTILVQ